jgi:hypothetical protein
VEQKDNFFWQAFRGEITVKLDVYSFGVVLLELLTSLPAFGTATLYTKKK